MSNLVKAHPPLAFLTGFGPVLAAVMAYLVDNGHLTSTESAYVTTVLVALAGLVTAIKMKDLSVGLLTAFATTVLTGLTTFSVVIPGDVVAVVVAVITFAGGFFLHQSSSPKTAT